MVIDATGAHACEELIAAAKAIGSQPFRRLINTHHHGDHVNGNQFFRRSRSSATHTVATKCARPCDHAGVGQAGRLR
jgi:glyoxylase-like metal-dependent hydrolase (beta-lactamase superfamily II)